MVGNTDPVGQHNFLYLLVGLLLCLLLIPAAEPGPWPTHLFFDLAFSAVLLFGIWSFADQRRWFAVGLVLALTGLALSLVSFWSDSELISLLVAGVVLLYCIFTTALLLKTVLVGSLVDANRLVGATCVYLMIGLVWAILYGFMTFFVPGAFEGLPSGGYHAQFAGCIYFSFVTLTTLGFGDIHPVAPLAQTLTYLEAVVGQLYLTVLVAGLVGALVAHHTSRR